MRFRLLVLVAVLISTHTVFASDFVITGDGLYFGPGSTASWPTGASPGTCVSVPRTEYSVAAGGHGIITQKCTSVLNPYVKLTLETYQFDSEFWAPCKILKSNNSELVLQCPRIAVD